MATLETREASAWAQWAQDFDRVGQLFATNYSNLQRLAPFVRTQSPAIQTRYNELVRQGASHQANLANLRRTRDQVGSWLTGLGRSVSTAASASWDWLRERFNLGAMGVVPIVVGVAGIAAAALVLFNVAKWIRDSLAFQSEMNEIYRLVQSGTTPAQAASIVAASRDANTSTSLVGSVFGQIPWKLILAGAAIIFLGPPLMRMIEKRG